MKRFSRAELGLAPPPIPKDIIITSHPKGRNRERLVTALFKMKAITPSQAREELGLIHTRRVTGPIPRSIDRRKATDRASQAVLEAGFYPKGRVGDAAIVGSRVPANTHTQTYYRQGADQPDIATDVRRVRTELHGKWNRTPIRLYSVEQGQLPDSMHLKGAARAVSHLSRGSKIHFRGFDEIVPTLAEHGMLDRIPSTPLGYEHARAKHNPFRIVGRFLEVSDNPQHYSKFSILSKGKMPFSKLAKKMDGQKVGARREDEALANLLLKEKGINCKIVWVANPEEAVSKGVVDFAFGHVTSGGTAKKHGLHWNPVLWSSQVAVVHKDALKNPKVTRFLAELKKQKALHKL
ncbi:MAG TPA: hypothetical protein VJH23_02365 [archaeon]|nr:hypothetical protein [archaeon]